MKKLLSILMTLAIAAPTFVGKANEDFISLNRTSGQAVIQGFVYDAYTNIGLEGVTIAVVDYTTTTLGDGSYTLIVDEGNYDLFFMKEGWITHVIPALVMVDTLNIDATLQRLPLSFPFTEDWSSGSFETNLWTFEPEQGNWQINDTIGNPEPSVIFKGDSVTTNYSFELLSHEIDLSGVYQNIALYFDLSLITNTPGSQENLIIDIWDGISWINIDTLSSEADITLTTNYFDITNIAAGKTIKVRFLAQGLDASNLYYWLIDNIRITQPPFIVVSPTVFYGEFSYSLPGNYNYPMTFYNDGLEPLNYSITITRGNTKVLESFPGNFERIHDKAILSTDPGTQPGGEPLDPMYGFTPILHYDGQNFDAIGLTAGGTFHVAARFPASMVGQYAGYMVESVDIYINSVPDNANLKIWAAGTATTPGVVLHQQLFTPAGFSWNNIELSNPVLIDGTDIWVGYSVTHNAGQYPAGCDSGPANPNGDWISLDGVLWEHLAGYGLNYNWNIRARLDVGPPQWLDVQPRNGVIAGGSNETLDVIFLNYNLWPYFSETAYINITTNDPLNPLMIVPVHIDVHNSIDNLKDNSWAICFPIPASDIIILEVKHEISSFKVIDQFGRIIITEYASGKTIFNINVKHLPNGLYFLIAEAKDGKIYSRKILISR
jgi:hypothetical protein